MRKLKLEVEDLAVESFSVTPDGVDREGTVHAAEASENIFCISE